jgi:hypothetical protein
MYSLFYLVKYSSLDYFVQCSSFISYLNQLPLILIKLFSFLTLILSCLVFKDTTYLYDLNINKINYTHQMSDFPDLIQSDNKGENAHNLRFSVKHTNNVPISTHTSCYLLRMKFWIHLTLLLWLSVIMINPKNISSFYCYM